jgi:hypothetical protein
MQGDASLIGALLGHVAREHQLAIDWVMQRTGASDRLLHIHAGMAIFVLASLISRRSLASPFPFAAVCLAEFIHESLERISAGCWMWPDTSVDALNTLLWPFVMMVTLRFLRVPAR